MKQTISSFIYTHIGIVLLVIAYIIVVLATYQEFGITTDEVYVYGRGRDLFHAIVYNDEERMRTFILPDEGEQSYKYYHNFYAFILYAFNQTERYETYHLSNMLVGSLFFIMAYVALFKQHRKPHIALLGPIILMLTPRLVGHIPANPKDIPFALSYFVSLCLIYLTYKWQSPWRYVVLGLSFGLTQSMRIVGYTIYIVYAIITLIYNRKTNKINLAHISSSVAEIAIIALLGLLVHVSTVPYLGVSPFTHMGDLLNNAKEFPAHIEVLFMGTRYASTDLPWYYLPIFICVTTPLSIVALAGVGIVHNNNSLLRTIMITALVTNFGLVLILDPVLYNGIRHMLYLLPIVSMLAAFGFIWLVRKKRWRRAIIVIASFNAAFIITQYAILHPYQYVYFNALTGWLPGAHGKFDIDYWTASSKEAVEWLQLNILHTGRSPVAVHSCSIPFTTTYYLREPLIYSATMATADYTICWERYSNHRLIDGTLIHSIDRMGVPLKHIYKHSHTSDSIE